MRRVDRATGKLDEHGSPYHLADRSAGPGNTSAIEAPFIISRAEKWYLFVSFDRCCQGVDSTYNVRVGRSDALTGPYLGREGVPLTQGGGITHPISLRAMERTWPYRTALRGRDVLDGLSAKQIGIPKLRIKSISWDRDSWPALPSQAQMP